MTDDSLKDYQSQCYAFGILLLKPRGTRKYYILDKGGYRFRLGKTWEEAKSSIWPGIKWLFKNYKQPEWLERKEALPDGSANDDNAHGDLAEGGHS